MAGTLGTLGATIPDAITPYKAWRAWELIVRDETLYLSALHNGGLWEPTEEFKATCGNSGMMHAIYGTTRHTDGIAPNANCTCGLYSTKECKWGYDYMITSLHFGTGQPEGPLSYGVQAVQARIEEGRANKDVDKVNAIAMQQYQQEVRDYKTKLAQAQAMAARIGFPNFPMPGPPQPPAQRMQRARATNYAIFRGDYKHIAIFGTCYNWGRVITHKHGYRAQFSFPAELYVSQHMFGNMATEIAQQLHKTYGVPVYVVGSYLDVVNNQKKTIFLGRNKIKEVHPIAQPIPPQPPAVNPLFPNGRIVVPKTTQENPTFLHRINPFKKDDDN